MLRIHAVIARFPVAQTCGEMSALVPGLRLLKNRGDLNGCQGCEHKGGSGNKETIRQAHAAYSDFSNISNCSFGTGFVLRPARRNELPTMPNTSTPDKAIFGTNTR